MVFFSLFGKIYKSDVVCNVVDMDAWHLLLGRPYQFDVNAIHKERENVYELWWKSKNVCLVTLTKKKKNSKVEGKNFLASAFTRYIVLYRPSSCDKFA